MSASWSSSVLPRAFPTLTAREAAPPPSHRLIGVNQYRRGTHRRHTLFLLFQSGQPILARRRGDFTRWKEHDAYMSGPSRTN
jgi:hypothetical protein